MARYSNKPASDEFLHLKYEANRTIEYIKHSMLTFLYYSSLLQAGIIAYHKLIGAEGSFFKNLLLISISTLIAFATMYFIKKFNIDYQYYLYRSERYIESKFSKEARKFYDKPKVYDEDFDKGNSATSIIHKYFDTSENNPFQLLYLFFNWGIYSLVIIYLFNSMPQKINCLTVNSASIVFTETIDFSEFTYIIFSAFAIAGSLYWFGCTLELQNKLKITLEKHEEYVKHLNGAYIINPKHDKKK